MKERVAHPEHEGTVRLLRTARATLGLDTDAQLAKVLGVGPDVVSRQKSREITLYMLLRIHDATGTPVNQLRAIAGLPTVAPYQRN